MKRIGRLGIALAIVGMLFAGLPSGQADAATATVTMKAFQFSPSPLRVRVGDTVNWVNRDTIPHQIVPDTEGFTKTAVLQPGQSAKTRITKAGTIGYHDSFSLFMRGTLVVSAGSLATPRPTARPTPRPTPRPTARPTARPTPKPAATTKATAKASAPAASTAAESSDQAGPTEAGPTASETSAASLVPVVAGGTAGGGGGVDVVTWLLLGLVGLAFAGGIWFSTWRRRTTAPTSGAPLAPAAVHRAPRPQPIDQPGRVVNPVEAQEPDPGTDDESLPDLDEDLPLGSQ